MPSDCRGRALWRAQQPSAHLGACTFRLPPMAVLADRACMMVMCGSWRRRKARGEAQAKCQPTQPEGSHRLTRAGHAGQAHETQFGPKLGSQAMIVAILSLNRSQGPSRRSRAGLAPSGVLTGRPCLRSCSLSHLNDDRAHRFRL